MSDTSKHKLAGETLSWEAQVNASIAELSGALIASASIDDISSLVLEHAKRLTGSPYGFIGFIDPQTGNFISTTLTREIWQDTCQVADKTTVFKMFSGLWGWVLKNRQPLLTNTPAQDPRSCGTPSGHIPIHRFLSAPALAGETLVGLVALANSDRDYSERDLQVVERLAGLYALAVRREQVDEALKKERDFSSAVIDTAGALVVVLDREGRIVRFNHACEQTTGYSFDQVRGKRLWDLLLIPEEQGSVKAVFETLRAGRFPNEHENHWVTKDGRRRLIAWSNTALLDGTGAAEYIVGTGIDITERQQAERQIRLQATALESAANGIVITDRAGNITWVNPAFTQMTGYAPGEILGQNPRLLKSGRHDELYYRNLWETILTGRVWRGELVNRRKDGSLYVEEQTITPLQDEHGEITHFIAIKRDITARKQAEEAMRAAQASLRNVIANNADGMIVVGRDGITLFANPAAQALLGRTANQIVGEPFGFPLAPGDAAEVEIARPGGETITAGIRVVETKWEGETAYLASLRDITEHKQIEEALLGALRRAEQVDQLKTQLLSIVSHELRTPLTSIRGQTTTLLDYADQISREEQLDALRIVDEEAARLDELIGHLLDMSRLEAGTLRVELVATDLRPILLETLALIAAQAPGHTLAADLPPTLPLVQADPRRVVQVVRNLLDNAIKFSPPGTTATVTAEVLPAAVNIHVRDQGTGIAPEHLPHIFERFYRGEGSSVRTSGAGLGLAICKGLVEAMGGRITVQSRVGHGCVFSFSLLRTQGVLSDEQA